MQLKPVATGLAFLIMAAPVAFAQSTYLVTDLGTLPGGSYSAASGINNNGQVVGGSAPTGGPDHAFLYSGGIMSDLGTLLGGSWSAASAINNNGQVVGEADTSSGAQHAFLYSGGIMSDLNGLIPTNSGWTLTSANAINDSGQIVGSGTNTSGLFHALLLTPVPLFVLVDGQSATGPQLVRRGSVTVTLLTTFTNGIILYTLDGSDPRSGASLYSHPFTLGQSGTLRAVAYSADLMQSFEIDPLAITILPTLSATTAGGGVVTVNPPDGAYLSNSVAIVTAAPSPGWTFLQWLGDPGNTNTPASITMTSDRLVQAVFGTSLGYNVIGSGSVAAAPLTGFYPYGTTVGLAAVPNARNYFLQLG